MNHRFDNKSLANCAILAISIALLMVLTVPVRGAVLLTPERVASALHFHAVKNSRWAAENVEVRVLPFQPVSLPASDANLRVLQPVNGILPGRQNFLIAAESGGKEHARFWVRAEVRVFEEVVVSSQPLAPQQIVNGNDVRLERREISALQAGPFYRIEEVVGQQVARAIAINETLTRKRLERPAVMRRGNAVVLVYESGSLRVETPGIAEENGRTGELIQVKNPASGKMLRGRVLDGRWVRVD